MWRRALKDESDESGRRTKRRLSERCLKRPSLREGEIKISTVVFKILLRVLEVSLALFEERFGFP